MNLGAAYTHLLDFLAAQEPLPTDVAKARDVLAKKADRLRVKQESRKRAALCYCGKHQKSAGLLVCFECWASTPDALKRQLSEAKSDDAKAPFARSIIRHALLRREVQE